MLNTHHDIIPIRFWKKVTSTTTLVLKDLLLSFRVVNFQFLADYPKLLMNECCCICTPLFWVEKEPETATTTITYIETPSNVPMEVVKEVVIDEEKPVIDDQTTPSTSVVQEPKRYQGKYSRQVVIRRK